VKALEIELPGARALFTTREGGRGHEIAAERGLELAWARQVHGTRVLIATEATDPDSEPAQADGLCTDWPGLALAVVTADCMPIAIAGGGAVGIVHAGWRGLAAGVIEEGAGLVRSLAASAEPLEAVIGPHARACCYEVGEEVHGAFAGLERARNGRNLDMAEVARAQLEDAGVTRVHDLGICTMCDPERRFFSHRRDGGRTGRQAGIAWLS